MTQTKTVSTRINENVHTLFTEYCNQKGRTMSEMLSLFINDIVKQNRNEKIVLIKICNFIQNFFSLICRLDVFFVYFRHQYYVLEVIS